MPFLPRGLGLMGQGAQLAVPVPVIEPTELIANGGFADDSAWTLGTGWSIDSGVATKTPGVTANISQIVLAIGSWYVGRFDIVSLAAGAFTLLFGNTAAPGVAHTSTGSKLDVVRAANTTASVRSGTTSDGTVDNVSYKRITLASMFSTATYTTHATTKAKATIVAGTLAGVVANLDSAASPANFVIASHDGTTARLEKCVAGTYTSLVSTAVAYSAGAYVEIRRLAASDTYQLFYNGSQVGTDQTISDAAISAATLHGYFNTYSGNTVSDFSCVASA